MPSPAVYLTVTQTATGLQFPFAPCGPELSARRARHPLAAQGRMNRPLPGVCETQCPGCGMLTSGPRAGWTPASYDALGRLTPVAFNPIETPRSAPCPTCCWVEDEVKSILQSPRRWAQRAWLGYLGLRPAVIAYLLTHALGAAA